ncbi:hypothetical protein MKW92_016681 [Papaver armeniacum]|nr:hypothetical protein MKW92_016681 [Papaver armeniacum]
MAFSVTCASLPINTSTPLLGAEKAPSTHDYSKGVKHLVDTASNSHSISSEYILPAIPVASTAHSHPAIPVIDLDGLNELSSEQRILAVQNISSACAEWGFFQIVNHGIEASLMEEMLKTIEGFFSLTCEEKMKYASDDVMNTVRYGTSLNTSKSHVLHWRDYLRHFGHPIDKSFHLWPDSPSNYREVTKKYLEDVWKLVMKIGGAISEGLGLERDYIEKSLGEGSQIIASNYYPPCPEPHLTLGLAAHSDHGGITILMQNDVDGLQVLYNDTWIPVLFIPGSLVVNLGDYLEILSNGRYKSLEHRAVVNEEKTRISIAVGHGPDLNSVLAPAPSLVGEKGETPLYRPIVYKDYMKHQQSITARGKEALKLIKINPTSNSSSPLEVN